MEQCPNVGSTFGSTGTYTATADGYVFLNWTWFDRNNLRVRVNGIEIAHHSADDSTAPTELTIPVVKSDVVTMHDGDTLKTGWTPEHAFFVPGSGGISVEDLKEELKKGTFENIKTKTLETTGNTTVDGDLTVKGNTQLGDSTADTTGISGNATVGKDLSVAGNETVNGNEVIRNFM